MGECGVLLQKGCLADSPVKECPCGVDDMFGVDLGVDLEGLIVPVPTRKHAGIQQPQIVQIERLIQVRGKGHVSIVETSLIDVIAATTSRLSLSAAAKAAMTASKRVVTGATSGRLPMVDWTMFAARSVGTARFWSQE